MVILATVDSLNDALVKPLQDTYIFSTYVYSWNSWFYFYSMALAQLELFPEAITEPKLVNSDTVFEDGKIKVRLISRKEPPKPEAVLPKKEEEKRGRKSTKEMHAPAETIQIPDDDILNQKLYYSISEVAAWFNLTTSQIRYWENEFDILQPRKNRKGDRLFRVEDIKNLRLIYFLLRNRKFSIEGAKEYLKSHKSKVIIQQQVSDTLTLFKQFLLELKSNIGNE